MKSFSDPKFILSATGLVDSFLEFVRIDTQSDDSSMTHPSTAKQLTLQKLLKDRLSALGCVDVRLDDQGYLYGTFPGNAKQAPVIGLIAHVDTAPDFSGANVRPVLHDPYPGGPIRLTGDVAIDPADNPELNECVGDAIITASGDTLLGADDKAGIAAICAALEILSKDSSIPCPTLRIAFTPDEEIGQGAAFFDLAGFNAHCAYTLDGDAAGEVNFETFSADKAVVTFTGVAVHPGFAKDKMVNALRYAGRFLDSLPREKSPERTEGREGFFHPTSVRGNASEAVVELILREFENDRLAALGTELRQLVDLIGSAEPRLKTRIEITEQYRNMADTLKSFPKARAYLIAAVQDAGLTPKIVPIRGGTDGSGLTAKGLPTPNIFTGGMNFHGPREWISTRVLALAVCTILNLVQHWGEDR